MFWKHNAYSVEVNQYDSIMSHNEVAEMFFCLDSASILLLCMLEKTIDVTDSR